MSRIGESIFVPQGEYSATIKIETLNQPLNVLILDLQKAQEELITWGATSESIFFNTDDECGIYEVQGSKKIPSDVLLKKQKEDVERSILIARNDLERNLQFGEEKFIKAYRKDVENLYNSQNREIKKRESKIEALMDRRDETLETLRKKIKTSSENEFLAKIESMKKTNELQVQSLLRIEQSMNENETQIVELQKRVKNIEVDFALMVSSKKHDVSYRITKEQHCDSLVKTLNHLLDQRKQTLEKQRLENQDALMEFTNEQRLAYLNWAIPKVEYHVNKLKAKIASF